MEKESVMTEAQKYKKITEAIRQYGIENSRTPELARAALIRTGIYDTNGKIKPQFDERMDYGGEREERKAISD
jgi:hypothetical protein